MMNHFGKSEASPSSKQAMEFLRQTIFVLRYIREEHPGEPTETTATYLVQKIYRQYKVKISRDALVYAACCICKNFFIDMDKEIVFPFDLQLWPRAPRGEIGILQPTKRLQFVLLTPSEESTLKLHKQLMFDWKRVMEKIDFCYLIYQQHALIGFVELYGYGDFSPFLLQIFKMKQGFGREVVGELERNMQGKTMYIDSLPHCIGFWEKLGFVHLNSQHFCKRIQVQHANPSAKNTDSSAKNRIQ